MALALMACSGASPTGSTTETGHTGTTDTAPPPPTQEDVEAAIETANTCTVAADCTDLGSQCPFGCWILVNEAEADAVQAIIDAYYDAGGSTCTYSCASRGDIRCDAGKCVADPVY